MFTEHLQTTALKKMGNHFKRNLGDGKGDGKWEMEMGNHFKMGSL